MPELLEVEAYRLLAERVVGNRIESVETPDGWFLKHTTATAVRDALIGVSLPSDQITTAARFRSRCTISDSMLLASLRVSSLRQSIAQ